jgi:hypothetical protein
MAEVVQRDAALRAPHGPRPRGRHVDPAHPPVAGPAGAPGGGRAHRAVTGRAALLLLAVMPVAAAVLGLSSLRASEAGDIGDYGLIQALGPGYFAALGLLSVSFVAFLARAQAAPWVGVLHLAVLVALVDGAPYVIEGEPRFPVTYVHAGFAEAIMRGGETLPMLDARFSWPGFFAFFGYLSEAAGLPDTMPLAVWFPFVIKVLWLAAMWVVLRRLFDRPAVCWLGLWLFQVAEWSGQSYYSPQALGVFIYWVTVAVLLVALDPARRPGPSGRAALAVVVLSFAALVVSHQLTPFMVMSAAGLLGVLALTRARTVWVLFGVLFVVWFSFGTTDYWVGHIHSLLGDAGQVSSTLDDNVADRIGGNESHTRVIYSRIALSGLVAVPAGLGVLLAWRQRRLDLRVVVLGGAPVGALLLQSYGGEGLIRVFLFMLPVLAGAAAYLLLAARGRRARLVASAATAVLLVGMLPLAMLAKYGGESFESVSASERRVAAWVHAHVGEGDLVASIAPAGYLRERRVGEVDFVPALDRFQTGDLRHVRSIMREHDGRRFLVLSSSQYAYGSQVSGLPADWEDGLLADLATAEDFELVHEDGSARVYEFRGVRDAR